MAFAELPNIVRALEKIQGKLPMPSSANAATDGTSAKKTVTMGGAEHATTSSAPSTASESQVDALINEVSGVVSSS